MEARRAVDPATAAELKARIEAERAGAPFLVYRDGEGAQRIVRLRDVRRLTVGRSSANEIPLGWDVEASRVHSELVLVSEEWTIADDGLSRNGTYVNGLRLGGRRRLRDGDVVRFGTTEALFRIPGAVILDETKPPVSAHPPPSLSPAQRRTLVALARPFTGDVEHAVPSSNREIADELVVTVDAVKANLRALFEKFDVEDLPQNRKRARLVELAFSSGAITRQDLA
jgi:pSer/pThr/pTyr-binding forkhead associated (FHA) protein